MERNYFRWMGCYDTEAGGRQTTTWYCDDETARGECQANEELLPGDVLFVAEGGEVYTVNSKRKVAPV